MSAHTKTHLTRQDKKTRPTKVLKKEKLIPWREAAKKQLEKYSEVGVVIRGSRFKEGFTQKHLAELLGVKPHHISEMEHGKRSVGKEMAKRLGKVFKVDYRVFL